jgi:hypothetical protein
LASPTAHEPAEAFYARLAAEFGTNIDLEAVIRENRGMKGEDLFETSVPATPSNPTASSRT